MILLLSDSLSKSSFFSSFSISDWIGIIGLIITVLGTILTVLFYIIPNQKAKKKAGLDRQNYYIKKGWIPVSELEYTDLQTGDSREEKGELNPSNHEEVFEKVQHIINDTIKKNNILITGPSLSGKTHFTLRFLKQLENAFVLLPNSDNLFDDTGRFNDLFPQPPKKARYKFVVRDDLQTLYSKGGSIPDAFINMLNEAGCFLWCNYTADWGTQLENVGNDFKKFAAFKKIEIAPLDEADIKKINNNAPGIKHHTTDRTIGSFFLDFEHKETQYNSLNHIEKHILHLIKQAYMLGFAKQGFEMPFEIIYNYFKVEYDAPKNTDTDLLNYLSQIQSNGLISKLEAQNSFLIEPAYMDRVVATGMKYESFINDWDDKGFMEVENWFAAGSGSGDVGDYEKAIIYFNKVVLINNNMYPAWYGLGIAYHYLGKFELAIGAYQKAVEIKSDYYDAWNNMGFTYFNLNNYQEAIKKYEKALQIKPDFFMPRNNLGMAYDSLGYYQKSIDEYQKAVALKPDYYQAWNNMGGAYFKNGEFDQAINSYDQAINIKPIYYQALASLAGVYSAKGDYENAIEKSERAIAIKPNDSFAWNNLGTVYFRQHNYTKAIEKFKKAVDLKPDNYQALNNMGNVYLMQNDYQSAIVTYKEAVKWKPDLYSAWLNMGHSYYGQGDYATALTNYGEAIKLKPDSRDAWFNMGHAYAKQKEYLKAIDKFEETVKLKPDDYEAWNDMGTSYALKGEYEKAIEKYNEAIKWGPRFHEPWNNMGVAYEKIGNDVKAQECFAKSDEILRNNGG